MDRNGVALIVVLWVIAMTGAVVATGLVTTRGGIATSSYRTRAMKARWAADACLALGRARLEGSLGAGSLDLWQNLRALPVVLDTVVLAPGIGCTLEMESADTTIMDLNSAPRSSLLSLPGFDEEVVQTLIEARRVENINDLLALLSAEKRDHIMAAYAMLVSRIQFRPSRVRAVGIGLIDQRTIPAIAEYWVRSNTRVAIVDRELF